MTTTREYRDKLRKYHHSGSTIGVLCDHIDALESEVARLLRVEKSARAFCAEQFTGPGQEDLFGWMARVRERGAELRAALEAVKEAT